MPASTVTCIGGPVQSKSREASASDSGLAGYSVSCRSAEIRGRRGSSRSGLPRSPQPGPALLAPSKRRCRIACTSEVPADYNAMIYAATVEEITARRGLPAQVAAQASCRRSQPRGDGRAAVCIRSPASEPVEERPNAQRNRAPARGAQAADQDAGRAAVRRNSRDVVLGLFGFSSDQHAQSRRLADPRAASLLSQLILPAEQISSNYR